ncbi:uncharacterized protein B0H18DRAFT_877077 [Fomitopsis serialis]|uniref:uncharacterized protein n=1 Tax=Fomitopsis serialis TaxID=139415 RepID=UPI0020089128|nr:uncharacterized protein B0H18DRAFT_877077 [Neoantrodia serialis]KAH9925525.1 hypothetical protein B0H18DRAFT_877077 [Neoantrodia serialis]
MADTSSVPAAPASSHTAATSTSTQDGSELPAFRYFRPPQGGSERSIRSPRLVFQPSTADLKAAQASLSRRTHALVNAPLKTQAVRDAEEKTKRARWPTTTIRIKFSDRSQLEKTFPSTDKIKAVYAFVRNSLREDVKPIKFVLYQTPPKREFKVSDPAVRDLTLAGLQLAPSSVLLLSFFDESLNHTDAPAPLDPSILAAAEDLPKPPNFDADEKASSASTAPAGRTLSGQPAPEAPPAEKKMPKWFKMGTST